MRYSMVIAALLAIALHGLVFLFAGPFGARHESPPARLPVVTWVIAQAGDSLGTRSGAGARRTSRHAPGAVKRGAVVSRPGLAVSRVSLQWPKGVKRTRIRGAVPSRIAGGRGPQRIVLEATVAPSGQVVGIRVANGGSDPGVLRRVRETMRGWRFAPLRKGAARRDMVCVVTWSLRPLPVGRSAHP